ncbi:MAG: ATP-dependent RNA helicase HrpA, partial [Kiritimatiellaeota bacterium]|nr:ATP-dependent RNA helicase HrpA [Kiritimatiellota bacterium]
FSDTGPRVGGRGGFPAMEPRWLPRDEDGADLPRLIANALDGLPSDGDVLVFLPGERDIREAAEHLAAKFRDLDIIPLLASLPAGEQQRAFTTSETRRRVILATNVAETSVTIPGIRCVIDSGLARVARYNPRTRVQRLHIEDVSQASANQRQGRCGRVGPGVCVRLYDEDGFKKRDPYTDPEIRRTALSGVILTMLDLRLGDIADFPFIDPPGSTAIRDGLRELHELRAIEPLGDTFRLTPLGHKLARLPVEPSLSRILFAAHEHAALRDALIVVAALECDDPRRRPIDRQAEADARQKPFLSPVSDFSASLKLWRWFDEHAKKLSKSALRRLCDDHFLSFPKMREWLDLHAQLEGLAKTLSLDVNSTAGGETGLHKALLTGLLSNIGKRDPESNDYLGAQSQRFALFPGSGLVLGEKQKKTKAAEGHRAQSNTIERGRTDDMPFSRDWILAGERVDTSRLFARTVACIRVEWIEPAAEHLCKYSHHSPWWDETHGFARVRERVTLHGLLLADGRPRDLSRIDPALARRLFIDHGLIEGAFPRPPPLVKQNNALLDSLREQEDKHRRHGEVVQNEKPHALFDAAVPAGICSCDAFRKWLAAATPAQLSAVTLKPQDFPDAADDARLFPDSLILLNPSAISHQPSALHLPLAYRHAPGEPDDGITCTLTPADIPLLRDWPHDWLVPGALPEKVGWLLHHLPPKTRRLISPQHETLGRVMKILRQPRLPLTQALCGALYQTHSTRVHPGDFSTAEMPAHLLMRFRLLAENGNPLAVTRDFAELEKFKPDVVASPTHLPQARQPVHTTWDFGDLPETLEAGNAGWSLTSHPALVDATDGVRVQNFPDPATAARHHLGGVLRLLILALGKDWKRLSAAPSLSVEVKMFLRKAEIPDATLGEEIARATLANLFFEPGQNFSAISHQPLALPRTATAFAALLATAHARLGSILAETRALVLAILHETARLEQMLELQPLPPAIHDDLLDQLAWLVFPGFITHTPFDALVRFPRYLEAARLRVERARLNPASDLKRLASELAPFWTQYKNLLQSKKPCHNPAALSEYRWMLEEFRVSLFAQQLKTAYPVSAKRLEALWRLAGE